MSFDGKGGGGGVDWVMDMGPMMIMSDLLQFS